MRTLRVTDNLVVEIWPSNSEGDGPLVKVRSLTMWWDGHSDAMGVVVVHPNELDALMAALTEAAMVTHPREREEKGR